MVSRKFWISIILLAAASPFPPCPVFAGGSDGGTDINSVTKEPVDFERAGKRVRIDPRTFEGIYSDLQPRLRAIEEKIPGLGRELESVFDRRSWFVTNAVFPPRKAGEERPILQTPTHVLLTASEITEMSHEQLMKAWLHEGVRRIIQFGEPETTPERGFSQTDRPFTRLSQDQIDKLVEKLTEILYDEYDRPARDLARYLNNALGTTLFKNDAFLGRERMGYLSRPELDDWILRFQLKKKYLRICKANGLVFRQKGADISSWERGIYRSTECASQMAESRTAEADSRYMKKCVQPAVRTRILAVLNALRAEKVETGDHYEDEPFRTSGRSEGWDDRGGTYDYYAHPPMNHYATLESRFGIGFLESGLSAAISGRMGGDLDRDTRTLSDAQRVDAALQACIFNSPENPGNGSRAENNEEISAILNARKSASGDGDSVADHAVATMRQALVALGMKGPQRPEMPASDARLPVETAKSGGRGDALGDSSRGVKQEDSPAGGLGEGERRVD